MEYAATLDGQSYAEIYARARRMRAEAVAAMIGGAARWLATLVGLGGRGKTQAV